MDSAFDRAAKAAGGQLALARLLGRSKQALSHWKAGRVPEDVCPRIEQVTGVSCEELRPDLRWVRIPVDGWVQGKPVLDVAPEVV